MKHFRHSGARHERITRFIARAGVRVSLLAFVAAIVLIVPAAALSGSADKPPPPGQVATEPGNVPPGQAKKDDNVAKRDKPAKAADPAKPAKAAEPGKAAKPAQPAAKPKPAKPAKAKPAKPAAKPKPAKPAEAAKPVSPGKSAEAQHHVIICHRTGSTKNPYVVINVSVRAWLHGHQTHPALNGHVDVLLKDPAKPGEKLSVSSCPGGGNPSDPIVSKVPNGVIVIDTKSSTEGSLPATTIVNKPLVIVVHTTPNATVTVEGAGVLGVTKTISNARGVARISVTPRKSGVLGVMVNQRLVKRVGVLGARTPGNQLTG
jgi:hypothetical protein